MFFVFIFCLPLGFEVKKRVELVQASAHHFNTGGSIGVIPS